MLSQKAEREEREEREHTEEHTQEMLCKKTAKGDNHAEFVMHGEAQRNCQSTE